MAVGENSDNKSPNKMSQKSPQKQPQRQRTSGKGVTFEVVLLDGEHVNFELDKNAEGRELFEKVCQHLDLIEKDYFGLQYVDERLPHHLKCWLSPEKKISKQKKRGPWVFDFALKFYPPDPTALRESLTRWLVTLQVRRDILSGKLPATFLTQAMLGSYCVQADVGDYDPNEHHGIDYIKDIPFAPNQTPELLEKIVELHRQHKGQTPDEAELNFLENAKKLSMYGVDLHAAQNHQMENSVCFKLASHRLAKRVWKISVEHHAFFRLREAEQPQNSALFPRLGSKFRYSGRTLYQARHSSQILDRPDPYFERSQPARSTYAAPDRSRSADELRNRPDDRPWKDDMDDVKRRPPSDGRDRRDHMGQPTLISQIGMPNDGSPAGFEEGGDLQRGPDDSRDRRDRVPSQGDATLERNRGKEGTMGVVAGLAEAEGPKETEKERKKREKEEEKRRKKEEEERKKGKDDDTMRAPGQTPGSYGDQEGGRLSYTAPLGASAPDDKDRDKDRDRWGPGRDGPDSDRDRREPGRGRTGSDRDGRSPGWGEPGSDRDRWGPGRDGPESGRDRYGPGRDGMDDGRDRWSPSRDGMDDGRDRWGPGKEGMGDGRDRWGPGKEGMGDGRDRWGPGKEGMGDDRDRWGPGKEGMGDDRDRWGPGKEGMGDGRDRWGPGKEGMGDGRDRWGPGKEGMGDSGDRWGPGKDGDDGEGVRWGPGGQVGIDSDKDGKDRKGQKDSDKDGKKGRKGSDKDDDKAGKKGGGLFSKFKKPKDSKSKLHDGEDGRHPGEAGRGPGTQSHKGKGEKDKSKRASLIASLCPGQSPNKKGGRKSSASSDEGEARSSAKDAGKTAGVGYPGYGTGVGLGAGDMSGVVGEESWIDNKQSFQPIEPRKKESKDQLKGGFDIDRTMPFFSPAATSTVGRPGKVPPPVPPKTDRSFDDSFNRTDVPPTVATESVQYNPDLEEVPVPTKNVPIVKTETRTVTYEREGFPFDSEDGVLVSARSHSTKMQTIETTTYKTEKDGIQETRVEHKVVVSSTDDDFDYDAALADAIRSVTEFNPDMSVERIECVQQIEEVKDK
ncbi:hypothetical protein BaRGS_00007540 [Batillaria attramentaria]|uniref:FERM domain-containing protein n=1 Tax=Batillaria attramentaria TaxID=370345 RepID=A0ABD0LNM3_9CAEN